MHAPEILTSNHSYGHAGWHPLFQIPPTDIMWLCHQWRSAESKPNYLSDSTSKARCTCPRLHINNKCVPQLRLYELSSCSVPKLFVSTSIIPWINSLPFERAPRLQKCLLFPATGFCQMVVVKGIRLTTHFELQSYFRCNEANRK